MTDDFDLDESCAQADILGAELLAALDALCKGIDESLYNVCTDLLVLENDFDDSEEDHDDDGKGT